MRKGDHGFQYVRLQISKSKKLSHKSMLSEQEKLFCQEMLKVMKRVGEEKIFASNFPKKFFTTYFFSFLSKKRVNLPRNLLNFPPNEFENPTKSDKTGIPGSPEDNQYKQFFPNFLSLFLMNFNLLFS